MSTFFSSGCARPSPRSPRTSRACRARRSSSPRSCARGTTSPAASRSGPSSSSAPSRLRTTSSTRRKRSSMGLRHSSGASPISGTSSVRWGQVPKAPRDDVSAVDALARAAEAVLPRVPPAWQGPIAEVAGTVAYLAAPRARAAVRSNLAVIAPEHPPSVRRVFVNSIIQYLEIFHIARLDRRRFLATMRMEGWENFTCAHALGKGVIFGSAHLGPVALVGPILMARGFELTLPVERTSSEFMRAVNRARSAQGMRLVPMDSAFGIHRVLRRGGVLRLLAGRAINRVGARVHVLWSPTLLASAAVPRAHRTCTALVPAFTWRENGMLVAHLQEPLDIPRTGDREADVREGVRRFAALLERYVRAHPEQWNGFDPVWGAA